MPKKMWMMSWVILIFAACAFYTPGGGGGYGYPGNPPSGEPAPTQGGAYGEIDAGFYYNYLSPYGTWVDYAPYGYCWVPRNMGYRWRPYIEGRWEWTDCGWTWISDYDWGWIPFHYGRWGWDNDIGWFWVPGSVWSPAWVVWRWSPSYFGWAPVPHADGQ